MIFSLSDFFGYSMAVTSACDYLNLSPEDFHNWEVRLDGVRFISGSLSYDVSFFLDFGCGECSWLLHLQMVRPKCLDS